MCFSLFIVVSRALNTISEGIITDACHALGDGDGGQAAAKHESSSTDVPHAVWDGDGGQTAAVREGSIADACHAVSLSIISDRFRNDDITRIRIIVLVSISHSCRAAIRRKVVIDTIRRQRH